MLHVGVRRLRFGVAPCLLHVYCCLLLDECCVVFVVLCCCFLDALLRSVCSCFFLLFVASFGLLCEVCCLFLCSCVLGCCYVFVVRGFVLLFCRKIKHVVCCCLLLLIVVCCCLLSGVCW